MKVFRKYSTPFTIFALIFIIVPMSLIVLYAFTTITIIDKSNPSFTLDAFKSALDPLYLKVMLESFKIALFTTLICLVIGYICAYAISKTKKRYQPFILVLFILPMWMNMLLRTYAWKSILSYNGVLNQFLDFLHLPRLDILNTPTAVLIGMVYNFLPFMIFPIYNSLHKMDINLINAAKDLGSSKFNVFRKVIFPLSLPGVISGCILVFMPSATNFTIPLYLGGGKVDLIGNVIERQFTVIGDWNLGSALSLIVLSILVITTFLMHAREKKYEQEI